MSSPLLMRPHELAGQLALPAVPPLAPDPILKAFPLRVSRAFAQRMRSGDEADPLLRQVWPDPREADTVEGFVADPLGEVSRTHAGAVIRKYHGRALVVATAACAIHCRYCFRRHFPYADERQPRDWTATLQTLAADPSLTEVILSGGDPLTLSDDRLRALARGLEAIPHLRRLRVHTRMPVVEPSRIGRGFLEWWSALRLQRVMVVHANHPNEIDEAVAGACRALAGAGTVLLNQSVLLAGVNDAAEILAHLSEKLIAVGVLPYYLHMLDAVAGAAHFQVDEGRAKSLMRALSEQVPGYLVPRLAREVEGDSAKTWVAW